MSLHFMLKIIFSFAQQQKLTAQRNIAFYNTLEALLKCLFFFFFFNKLFGKCVVNADLIMTHSSTKNRLSKIIKIAIIVIDINQCNENKKVNKSRECKSIELKGHCSKKKYYSKKNAVKKFI